MKKWLGNIRADIHIGAPSRRKRPQMPDDLQSSRGQIDPLKEAPIG